MPEPTAVPPHADAAARPSPARDASSATRARAERATPADIQGILLRHLQENYLPQGGDVRIGPGEDLFDSGVLDSAAVLSVVLFIEQEFAITIPDEDLLPENVASVDAAVVYITGRLDGGRSDASTGEEAHGTHEEVPGLGSR